MKKILFAALALMTSLAFAGSVTVEGTNYNTLNGGADQKGALISFSENINKTFSVQTAVSTIQTETSNAIGSRLEAGVTATVPLFGPVVGSTKVALGQKYSTKGQFTYYLVEPAIAVPLSNSLTAKVAYRFRTAAENPNVNNDTTQTVRVGLNYDINKEYTVGTRYDRVTGDSRQDAVSINFTRSF